VFFVRQRVTARRLELCLAIDQEQVVKLVGGAGRLVGIKELLRVGAFNPGVQNELKRLLRELVKQGRLTQDGKRFGAVGARPERKSGPAWAKPPAVTVPVRGRVSGRPTAPPVREPPRGKHRGQKEAPLPARTKGQHQPAHGERRPDPRGARTQAPQPVKSRGGKLVEGILHMHPDGFAFLKPIVGQVSEDLFIPPDEARKALDHDLVQVEVVPGRGGRTMGRVIEVKSRTRQLVVGTYFEDGQRAWVTPREVELGQIRVPPTQLARPGDAVKVRLGVGDSYFSDRDHLTGEVAGSLGSNDDHSVEVLSVAFAKGFHDEFPTEVMDEADQIPIEVAPNEALSDRRRDLRSLPLITIDGEDARDFDDAIFVEPEGGGWRLVVAIADVSHYVREGTAIDAEALRRATSVYLPGRVLPMLPERLSNGICSLRPDVDRLCMVADMVISRAGETLETEIYPAVMRSHARCTYTEVHRVLAGEDVPGRTQLKPLFERANELATTLTTMRLARGAIDFDLPETRVVLDDKGQPTHMAQRERQESHRLVEECMLAANEAVARFFREQGVPTVNRYHADPDEEKLGTFLNLLRAFGIETKGELDSKELNRILKSLAGHPEQRALNQLALRAMMQAVYSSQNTGHFGLGADDYLHFTSPIRRYPDLLVHRLLKGFWSSRRRKLSGGALEGESERLEQLSIQCSERERAAMQVEREVSALYACLLMKDRIGEEFDATVGGLSEHGFFVVLDEHHVEGFVKGESVFPDFELDVATHRLKFGDGRQVRIGQKARVALLSVNLQKKQMEFGPLSLEGAEVVAPKHPRGRPAPHARHERGGHRQPVAKEVRKTEAPARGGRPDWKKEKPQRPRTDERRRSPQPPAGAPRAAKVAVEGEPGFSATAVLDRLWKERGSAATPKASKKAPARDDRNRGSKSRGKGRR
jgi:ribonuclease R